MGVEANQLADIGFVVFPVSCPSSYLASLVMSYAAASPLTYLPQCFQSCHFNSDFPFNLNISFHSIKHQF